MRDLSGLWSRPGRLIHTVPARPLGISQFGVSDVKWVYRPSFFSFSFFICIGST
jgi:hypothetical protein